MTPLERAIETERRYFEMGGKDRAAEWRGPGLDAGPGGLPGGGGDSPGGC